MIGLTMDSKRKMDVLVKLSLLSVCANRQRTTILPQKVHISRRNFATKFIYVKTVSNRVVRHLLAIPNRANTVIEERPLKGKFSS